MTSSTTTTTTTTTTTPQSPIPYLPYDISIQCLARISRDHHTTLTDVSEHWKSAIFSKDFLHTRSLLNITQDSLYLNIHDNTSFKWFHIFFPNTPCNETVIETIPSIPFQPVAPAYAVVGPNIYVLGGSAKDVPTNDVWVLDCRVNDKWVSGPKMRVGRESAASGVVGGKVYVMGGCLVNKIKAMDWAEKLDPDVGVWSRVGSEGVGCRDKWMRASAVIDGRVYAMADSGGVVYDVGKGVWGKVPKELEGWKGRAAVVKGVLYCFDSSGKIRGYDGERCVEGEKDVWKELKGVEKGLPKFEYGATMVDLGGRLCVVWDKDSGGNSVDVMCAVIEVGKDEDGGLSGEILWVDKILSVRVGSSILHCMAVAF